MKYILTPTANISLEQITEFLKQKWTHKELAILKNDIKKFKKTINEKIVQHPSVYDFPQIKYTIIGKRQVKLFYELKDDSVVIKLFWHCRQNPEKMNDLLRESEI